VGKPHSDLPGLIYTTEIVWMMLAVAARDVPTGVVLSALVACKLPGRVKLPRGVQGEWLLRDGTYPVATQDLMRRGLITFTDAGYRCLVWPPTDTTWHAWLQGIARDVLAAGETLEAERATWRTDVDG
jgi:hypothetical protein